MYFRKWMNVRMQLQLAITYDRYKYKTTDNNMVLTIVIKANTMPDPFYTFFLGHYFSISKAFCYGTGSKLF